MRFFNQLFKKGIGESHQANEDTHETTEISISRLREERKLQKKARKKKSKKAGTLESKRWEERRDAVENIGEIGTFFQTKQLLRAVEDKVVHVRKAAFRVLGEVGAGNAVIPLFLHDCENTRKHQNRDHGLVYETLLVIASKDITPFIQDGLQHENVSVRCGAAEILGDLGDLQAVTPLIKALRDHDVSSFAATALGKICDQRAIVPLINCLRGDRDTYLVVQAIQQIKNRHGENSGTLSSKMLSSLIKAVLTDSLPYYSNKKELEKTTPEWHKTKEASQQIPAFIAALAAGDRSVLWGLEKILPEWEKSPEATAQVEKFIRALKPENPFRDIAPIILGNIGNSIAVPYLLDNILEGEEDNQNKEIYIEALKNIGGERAIEALVKVAHVELVMSGRWQPENNGQSFENKWIAIKALVEMGSHLVIELLLGRLQKFCQRGYFDSLGYPDSERSISHINHICKILVEFGSFAILSIKRALDEYPYEESFYYPFPEKLKDVLQRIEKNTIG